MKKSRWRFRARVTNSLSELTTGIFAICLMAAGVQGASADGPRPDGSGSAGGKPYYDESSTQCSPLYVTRDGQVLPASSSAHAYSKYNKGAVGIYIEPGDDLGGDTPDSYAAKLVELFVNNGIESECFVSTKSRPGGTGINFKIDGLSYNSKREYNIAEAYNIELLKGVAVEARMVKMTVQ